MVIIQVYVFVKTQNCILKRVILLQINYTSIFKNKKIEQTTVAHNINEFQKTVILTKESKHNARDTCLGDITTIT